LSPRRENTLSESRLRRREIKKPSSAVESAPALDPLTLTRELVAIPGPPGQEAAVRVAVEKHVKRLGYSFENDEKGNLIVRLPAVSDDRKRGASIKDKPTRVLVTAHLDEIALMVQRIEGDGRLKVTPMGGAHPWKWGETPVNILAEKETFPGVLSFGCIHTSSPASVVEHARGGALSWDHVRVFTGKTPRQLAILGVRPGTRVTIHPERRTVIEMGEYVASYFIDDRADLVALLLALEALRSEKLVSEVVFAATTCEEVGGEGAKHLMHRLQPEICIALEIGPTVPESPFYPDEQPTIWVTDSFSSTAAEDLILIAGVCREIEQDPHWQALSRGGSDASCAAAAGLCARPITLGLPVENSHGFEIMHRDAPAELARLVVALVKRLTESERPS
jgi:putative aminopeptidase FrvX